MDDPSAALVACEAGQGLFQSFELGLARRLASGKLVQVLPEWSDERFPLYAYPSRRQAPAKLRAFPLRTLESDLFTLVAVHRQ
jgi:DNA-binding transcriptional LysR family regulator